MQYAKPWGISRQLSNSDYVKRGTEIGNAEMERGEDILHFKMSFERDKRETDFC